jgi:hypothetical protein
MEPDIRGQFMNFGAMQVHEEMIEIGFGFWLQQLKATITS